MSDSDVARQRDDYRATAATYHERHVGEHDEKALAQAFPEVRVEGIEPAAGCWRAEAMTQLPQPRTSAPQLHLHIAVKVRQLAPKPATRILDLGCGSGALLERLAGMGYRDLTGVDIRPPDSGASITYRQADLDCFRLDCADGAFDLALEVEVIEHIENTGLLLAEQARLLRPRPSCCSDLLIALGSPKASAIQPLSRRSCWNL